MELSTRSEQDNHIEGGADRIRALRLLHGLTAAEVAAAMGWHSRSRVACYENRHAPFSAAMEARIAQAILDLAARKAGDDGR